MDQGYDVYKIYLDYTKTFLHKHLLEKKLWGYGIRGKIDSWIKDFLNNRIQRVAVNWCFSSYENVTSGIPRGSVLGRILSIILINDLPDVTQVMMRMFADDSKIQRRLKTPDHVNQVQASVNLKHLANVLLLQKCHHLHIGNDMEDKAYTMETTNERVPIEKFQSEKDLGVTFDSKLNFTEHISSKVKKANQVYLTTKET